MDAGKDKSIINLSYFSLPDSGHNCGYCKNKDGSFTWGFVSDKMLVDDYESLMFKGWRRSGTYFYKPDGEKSCCQLYPIRLDVDKFVISKAQKKIMKKFNRFLMGETQKDLEKEVKKTENNIIEDKPNDPYEYDVKKFIESFNENLFSSFNCDKSNQFLHSNDIKPIKNKNCKNGDYSSNLLVKLLYFLKKENCFNLSNEILLNVQNFSNNFSEILNKFIDNSYSKDKWDISLSKTGHINFTFKNREEITKFNENFGKKSVLIQKTIQSSKLTPVYHNYFNEFVPSKVPLSYLKRKYTINLENAMFSNEKYEVYRKYQIAVHGDKPEKVTTDGFSRFLCDSPLFDNKSRSVTKEIHPKKYGSYHLVHKIDNRIFAVGVLDILPTSISSVYLFYDPEFKYINPGIFTAIKEIEYVMDIRKNDPNMLYYVMGFYIHTCHKMRYKGEYEPSEILCPITLRFCDLKGSIPKLEKNVYMRLADEKESIIEDNDIKPNQFDEIYKGLTLSFRSTLYTLYDFVYNLIQKKYKDVYLNIFKHLVSTFGKTTSKNVNLQF
jgi:arginine-tRNA-protein transferase